MIIVMLAWIGLFCVLAGLGSLIRRAFGLYLTDLDGWFSAFWMGFAVAIAALILCHLLLPVAWKLAIALGLPGLVGLFLGIKSPQRVKTPWLRVIVLLILLAPLALWIANRCLDPQLDYDSAL